MYLNIVSWVSWRVANPLLLICTIHNRVSLNLGVCIQLIISE
jgi:hypothetical protein